MKFRIRSTGAVIEEYAFRESHANVSFPAAISAEIAADFGADLVTIKPHPAHTQRQEVKALEPVLDEETAQWLQDWEIVEITDAVRLAEIDQMEKSQLLNSYRNTVLTVLNQKAIDHGYDDIKSAALRAGFPGPYHDEGVAFATWMDECWWTAYELLDQVAHGHPVLSHEELVAQLPVCPVPDKAV